MFICFDLAYNILFRCSKKKLVEYRSLHRYTRQIYQTLKIVTTCNFGAIVDSYYRSHDCYIINNIMIDLL
ncbi:hypothetical protein KSP39_PZI022225 [Platanthera zijinensis]|uniref:Uncharacterized protein n=1 Tax=Platanthera zijinensis TaxID=2320716 RepID=A0AAP0FVI7_9ASPA